MRTALLALALSPTLAVVPCSSDKPDDVDTEGCYGARASDIAGKQVHVTRRQIACGKVAVEWHVEDRVVFARAARRTPTR